MEHEKLTPQQSLDLITEIINEARGRIEENGFIYTFWGALISMASFGQFYLLQIERYDINWYPYLLIPLGFIFTSLYFAKKKRKSKNLIGKILTGLWTILAINMMILGFLYAEQLRENLMPIILILQSTGILVSGIATRQNLLLTSGVIIGLSAYYSFTLDIQYQPLLTGIVSIVTIFIPGMRLMYQHKRLNNV